MGWREKGPRKSSFQLSDWRVFGQEPSEHAAPLSPSGATAIQHYLLHSALPTATLKKATEEGRPGGTAGGQWGLLPPGFCVSSDPALETDP